MKIELQRLVDGIWYVYGKYDMSITHDATAFGEAVSELAKHFDIRTTVSYTDVEKQLKEERELNAEIKARFVKCNTCTQEMKDKCLMFSENLCEGERCEELVDLMALVEKNVEEDKIADIKANCDYVLEGKEIEHREELNKLCADFENMKATLESKIAELEKDRDYAEEQLNKQIEATLKLQKEYYDLKETNAILSESASINQKDLEYKVSVIEQRNKKIAELERLHSNQAESLRITMLEEEKKGKRIEELEQQIEKMKICWNCKFEEIDYMEKPCCECSRCLGDIKREGTSDKWELKEND